MDRVLSLTAKDLRLLLRDRLGFFFTFFLPILYATFFGSIYPSGGAVRSGIKVALVDEDQTEESRAFAAALDQSPELHVFPAATRNEASDLVRRGKRTAYVILPAGFGESRRHPLWGEPPKIETGIDPARRAEAGMLQGILTARLYEGIQEMFSNPDIMRGQIRDSLAEIRDAQDMDPLARTTLLWFLPALEQFLEKVPEFGKGKGGFRGFQPAQIETADVARKQEGPKNAFEISFPQGIIWGLIGCTAGFGIAIVSERRNGTLVRLRMSPIGRTHILAAKGLACWVTSLCVMVVLLSLAVVVFGVRPDSFGLLALAIVSVSLSFVGIMMLLSVLGKTEQATAGIGWAVMCVMAMLGGGMIPLFIMPGFMQTLSHVSPVKWAVLALEGAIWRGFSLSEMMLPCAILLGVGGVCFAVGARAFRWTEQG